MRTAEELGITEEELDALIKVRDGLSSGCFTHVDGYDEPPVKYGFNMVIAGNHGSCGTVACIGGWMAIVMSSKMDDPLSLDVNDMKRYVSSNMALERLFYPPVSLYYSTITPDQAALAIDNFLATGDPRWKDICHEDQEI